jgi:hypothetical protein
MEGRRTSASTLNADPPQVIKMNECDCDDGGIDGRYYLLEKVCKLCGGVIE